VTAWKVVQRFEPSDSPIRRASPLGALQSEPAISSRYVPARRAKAEKNEAGESMGLS